MAVGSDGNPIGTFGKGDRLAINEAAIRAGLGASSDVAQKLAEVKDTLGAYHKVARRDGLLPQHSSQFVRDDCCP